MDVKHNVQSARPGSFLMGALAVALSLSQVNWAVAEVVFASDAEAETQATSTIFITDDTPIAPPKAPSSVEGSIVFVEDVPSPPIKRLAQPAAVKATATFVAPKRTQIQPAARGELKVVTNPSQPTTSLTALRPIPKQLPLQPLAKLPNAPASAIQTAAVIEPLSASEERDQPGDIQVAVHAEPVQNISGPANAKAIKPALIDQTPTTPEALLVTAHKLSITAKTSAEYSKINQWCAQALSHELKGDQSAFASNLAAWALNRRGQLRSEAGEQDLANADFQAALELNPSNWRAMHNRGVSHAQSGAFAEAFDDFSSVIQLNPQYAKAYANRATLFVQAKDLDSAIKDYQRAILHDDQLATAHVGLGRVCHMLGNWEDALTHFSAAIKIEPNSPDVICSRGDLQADIGNYGEALADYARTIEIDPEFGHAYRNGAWLLATCPDVTFRDPENAVLGAQQALEHSYGERHVALDTLAAALASNGQFDEAVSTITQAVDLAPENTKYTYLSRLQLYQENQPFRTEPIDDVSQATYEVSDE